MEKSGETNDLAAGDGTVDYLNCSCARFEIKCSLKITVDEGKVIVKSELFQIGDVWDIRIFWLLMRFQNC